MKQKISLYVIALIMILPIALYAVFKTPQDSIAIAATGKPTVVEFSSPLCSECQKLKKVLDIVEPKYSNKISFQKINTARMDRKTMKEVIEMFFKRFGVPEYKRKDKIFMCNGNKIDINDQTKVEDFQNGVFLTLLSYILLTN